MAVAVFAPLMVSTAVTVKGKFAPAAGSVPAGGTTYSPTVCAPPGGKGICGAADVLHTTQPAGKPVTETLKVAEALPSF